MKNKVAPPFKRAEFDIMFGEGISRPSEIIDLAEQYNIVQKSGSWYSYNGSKLGQGREGVKAIIADNPELAAELEEKILEALRKNSGARVKKAAPKAEAPAPAPKDDDIDLDDFDDELPDDFTLEEDI